MKRTILNLVENGPNPAAAREALVVAVDPGEHAGWAVGTTENGVVKAGAGNPPDVSRVSAPVIVVIERPVITPGRGVNGNDIITLALNAGRWIERYRAFPLFLVPARSWKGSLKKKIHHAHVRAMLAFAEASAWDALTTHDARDAFALCHWALRQHRASPSALNVFAYRLTGA